MARVFYEASCEGCNDAQLQGRAMVRYRLHDDDVFIYSVEYFEPYQQALLS